MWQPSGRFTDPPALNSEQEMPPDPPPLTPIEHPNSSQIPSSREILHIASGTRVTRGVVPRKRGPRRHGSDSFNARVRQANTSSQNNIPQHDSSWALKYRRCSDTPSKRHFRMANLYDIQYTSDNLLNSMPDEVIHNVNDDDSTHRFLNMRQHESVSNQMNVGQPSENLAIWPLKHNRFSNYNEDYNMVSSYSSTPLLRAGMSQCSAAGSPNESELPELFSEVMDNTTSISHYSAVIGNATMSCSDPSTSFSGFPNAASFGGTITSSFLACSDTSSDTSSSDVAPAKLYSTERYGRRSASDRQNEEVSVEMRRVRGSSNLNRTSVTVQARKVANRVITHTRIYKTLDESVGIWCLSCDRIPTLPVTGQCGHTRCSKCVKENDTCPCGTPAPRSPCVNTVIQGIIDKIMQHDSGTRFIVNSMAPTNETSRRTYASPASPSARVSSRRVTPSQRSHRAANGFISIKKYISSPGTSDGRMPMTPQARYRRARELLACGRYREAAPHLARVAASAAPFARVARTLLAKTISALSQGGDPRRLTRDLFRMVRQQSAASWLKANDLECVLCYHTYTSPVTTPCGHTYCRTCIERSLDYKKMCALCQRPLADFNLATIRECEFVCAALAAIDAVSAPSPPDPDVIPIFVCTVAFPSIPCPLFIFDPRYWLMIRRILESGSRKFGMVAYERHRTFSDYGTVLEVCDCVHLEDGRSILSTVGVSRFRVIERDVRDGCDVARIQPLIDVTPTEDAVWHLRVMSERISYKALVWLDNMNRAVRAEIEAAFGPIPHFHSPDDWWESADGPQWLWWLIAILPLRSEIKILILSTRSLKKRMMAVARTLEVMDSVAFTSNNGGECDLGTALSTAEAWLERSA